MLREKQSANISILNTVRACSLVLFISLCLFLYRAYFSLWGRKASVMAYASEKRQSAKSSKLAGETFDRLPAISDFLTVLLSSHLYLCN
jgi:hypothetical protein